MATEENFNIELTELEFKYDGSEVKLSKFVEFAQANSPVKRVEVSGWDHWIAF